MVELSIDKNLFIKRILRRIFFEMAVFVLVLFLFFQWGGAMAGWIKYGLLGGLLLYIAFGALYVPKALKMVSDMRLVIDKDAISFIDRAGVKKIPVNDIERIEGKSGKECKVKSINVHTKHNDTFKIEGYESIDRALDFLNNVLKEKDICSK